MFVYCLLRLLHLFVCCVVHDDVERALVGANNETKRMQNIHDIDHINHIYQIQPDQDVKVNL